MLSLIKGADSVELKLTIPESSQRSTIEALGIDPLGAQVRLVHFYDTPDLSSRGRRRRARAPRGAEGRRLGGQAAARRGLRAAAQAARVAVSAWSRSTRCPAATSARRR